MSIVNPNVKVREGGFLEAMRYALENKICFVMAMVEVPMDKEINATSETLVDDALKELGMSADEFNTKVTENTVQVNIGGYHPMGVEEYLMHINDCTAAHEAPSVIFVSEPEKVLALVPGRTVH